MKGSTLILLGVVGGTVACDAPEVNGNTVGIIKQLEGFRANLYDDGYGTQHVGYGHACKQKDCAELPYPIPISEADAEKVLVKDLGGAEGCVEANVDHSVKLNANQYGALVSFTFNVGCGQFRTSTLIQRLNGGENPSTVVAEELPKWNKAGGKVAPGLVERRKQEIALFDTPTSAAALPACDEPTSTPTPTPTSTATATSEPTSSSTEQPPTSSSTAEPTSSVPSSSSQSSEPTGSSSSKPTGSSTTGGSPTSSVPNSSSCNTPVPTITTTVSKPAGGSTGTNTPPKPTCTNGSCVPITNGGIVRQVGAAAIVAAVAAALF